MCSLSRSGAFVYVYDDPSLDCFFRVTEAPDFWVEEARRLPSLGPFATKPIDFSAERGIGVAILGGGSFLIVFVCTLKLSYYLSIGNLGWTDPADGVAKNTNAMMHTAYEGSGWAQAALYLQCFVIASIFFTGQSGTIAGVLHRARTRPACELLTFVHPPRRRRTLASNAAAAAAAAVAAIARASGASAGVGGYGRAGQTR